MPIAHESHQADDGIVGFDQDDRPGRDMRQIGWETGASTRPVLRNGFGE